MEVGAFIWRNPWSWHYWWWLPLHWSSPLFSPTELPHVSSPASTSHPLPEHLCRLAHFILSAPTSVTFFSNIQTISEICRPQTTMSSNSESFGRRSSSPSRSDSGYSSSDRSAPTFGLNSVTPSTAPSTYAQSTCFDEHGDPVHSSTRSATSFRYGANTTRRPESVRSFASCSDVAATMKIDEDARYRAVRVPCSMWKSYGEVGSEADAPVDK